MVADVNKFTGPLFIVGLSRSGTKLLRALLNRHSRISIVEVETHFIPYLLKRMRSRTAAKNREAARRLFVRIIISSNFYRDMERKGRCLAPEDISDIFTSSASAAAAIEKVLRRYSQATSKVDNFIWGDKTPTHITSMDILKAAFPQSRFIHIIRDPRDRALSAKEAWGADIYLSAIEWYNKVTQADRVSRFLGNSYFEIRYEDLIRYTEKTIRDVCGWLEISFEEGMLLLESPVENQGSETARTRISSTVISANYDKYKEKLSDRQIKKFDALVCPALQNKGYSCKFNLHVRKNISAVETVARTVMDQTHKLLSFFKWWGVKDGFRYAILRNVFKWIK